MREYNDRARESTDGARGSWRKDEGGEREGKRVAGRRARARVMYCSHLRQALRASSAILPFLVHTLYVRAHNRTRSLIQRAVETLGSVSVHRYHIQPMERSRRFFATPLPPRVEEIGKWIVVAMEFLRGGAVRGVERNYYGEGWFEVGIVGWDNIDLSSLLIQMETGSNYVIVRDEVSCDWFKKFLTIVVGYNSLCKV